MIGGIVLRGLLFIRSKKYFLINVCIGKIRTLSLVLREQTGPCNPTLYLGERKKVVSVSFFVSIPRKTPTEVYRKTQVRLMRNNIR